MKIIFYICIAVIVAVMPFLVFVGAYWLYWRFVKHIKPIKNEKGIYKEKSILNRLFIQFPKQLAHDLITIDPNTFRVYGMHLLCGEQGSGKTTLMAYLVRKYKRIYPKVVVKSNFSCQMEDYPITSWRDLTLNTNGIYGEIDCIDEIQNWFSSNQSKNFPPDMLTVITQQRKVRRCVLATSQVFTRVAKPIRENTYLMYYPFTVFGCITFVRVYKPILDETGQLKERKLRKFFFFVHDEELRSMFDSYKTICTLSSFGFVDRSEQISTEQTPAPQATATDKR